MWKIISNELFNLHSTRISAWNKKSKPLLSLKFANHNKMVFVLSKISAPQTLFLLALKYLAFFPCPYPRGSDGGLFYLY